MLSLGCSGTTGNEAATDGTAGTSATTTRTPGSVGASCTNDAENIATFSGFDANTRDVGYDDTECNTDACVAIGFVGRKSCPEGQTEEEVAAGTGTCLTAEGKAVTVSVAAQTDPANVDRHVFCSCRCDSGFNARCECPSDMECVELVRASSLRGAISFCVYPDSLP
jgi:hypothetical protein